MFKIIKNALSSEQISILTDYWDNNSDLRSVNWEIDGKVLDYRLKVLRDPGIKDMLEKIISKDFTNVVHIYAALQQQKFAHQIHIDDYDVKEYPGVPVYTYIFALDTVPEFKTIVWKETFESNSELHEYLKSNYKTLMSLKSSNISETEDLEHTYEDSPYRLCDHLTLDGIFQYQAGDGVLFNARQLHTTSNWLKYQKFNSRRLLQLHIASQNLIT